MTRRHRRSIRAARLIRPLFALALLASNPAFAEPQAQTPAGVPATVPAPAEGVVTALPEPGRRPAAVTSATGGTLHDLSPWSMFLNADILVKAIMVGLAAASVLTWTILLAKSLELALARRALLRALKRVGEAATLAEAERALPKRDTVLVRLVAASQDEIRLSRDAREGIKERAASRASEIVKAEGRAARRGMGALATIGAISPFVGLFGTVWGIMNSFIGISKSQTTNLAVVAPGIAEALLATAIGLVAAIPAVIIYNHFARATRGYGDLVHRASGATLRLLSRDIDRAEAGGHGLAFPRAAE